MSNLASEALVVTEERPGSLAFSVAAIAASLFAAWVIPEGPPGIGLPLVALAVGCAVLAAKPHAQSLDLTVFGALSLLLVSTAALRAEPVLVLFNLMAAAGFAVVSIGGGDAWHKIFLSWLAPLLRVHLVPGFLVRPLADRIASRAAPGLGSVFRGVFLAAILLLIFGTLFASADAAFAYFTDELIPNLDLGLLPARIVVFLLILTFTALLALLGPRFDSAKPFLNLTVNTGSAPQRLKRIEWTISLVSLDILFLVFVVLQLTVLFGGNEYVLKTAGLTYADYARQGFFQLLVAGALSLAVVGASAKWAERNSHRDQQFLKAVLGVLCALVLVVLASALHRLGLYEEAFGFTRARLIGHTMTIWLGAVFVLVMVSGALASGRWLPRASLALTGVTLVAFSLINPDGTVARHNIERYENNGAIDVSYLATLSADAVPEFTALDATTRECLAFRFEGDLSNSEPWSSFNFSRNRARELWSHQKARYEACELIESESSILYD